MKSEPKSIVKIERTSTMNKTIPQCIWCVLNIKNILKSKRNRLFSDCKYNSKDHLYLIYYEQINDMFMNAIVNELDDESVLDFLRYEKWEEVVRQHSESITLQVIDYFRNGIKFRFKYDS